jgi:tRNA A-37 threonylcarbamoyl transferase component Bud32
MMDNMIESSGSPGQTLNGRYQIETHISQGGMATVYRATDLNLGRVVAVKIIHPHLSRDAEFVRRFEKEAKTIAQLRHPNIVQIFDYNHDDSIYYIVLEMVIGETLQTRLKRLTNDSRTLELEETIAIAAGMGNALEYAHSQGVIHRDVKPANVLLNVQGEAILTDFGIAKMLGETQHTATGAVLGTARYMSPEQIKGRRIDGRTDIYSLGVMLFEMVGGRLPFESDSVMTMMMMHVNDPVPDLRRIRPDVPSALIAIINKALAKEPDARYQSAEVMADALHRMGAGAEHLGDTTILEDPSALLLEPIYLQLLTAVAASNWEQALALGQQIEARDASYKDVAQLTALARAKLDAGDRQPLPPAEDLGPKPGRPLSKGIWIGVAIVLLLLTLGLIFGPRLFSAPAPPAEAVARTDKESPGATGDVAVVSTDTPPPSTEKPAAVPTHTPRPTKIPATTTSTPVPYPTSTRDKNILFEEDFEDGKANVSTYNPGNWEIKNVDGNMVFAIDNSQGTEYPGFDFGSSSWKNFSIRYRVRMENLIDYAPQIILEFRKSADAKKKYIQSFTPYYDSVHFAMTTTNGSSWQELSDYSYYFTENKWYSVKVDAFESSIKIYVDDALLIDTTESQLSSGSVNLQAGPGSIVQFDDIKVLALDE